MSASAGKRKRVGSVGGPAPKRRKSDRWLREYWDDFYAEERDWNDGAQSCGAKLHYTDAAGQGWIIAGSTGQGAGHAEMHALTQFIRNVCNFNEDTLTEHIDRGLHIECPAKACCVRCSIVLGALHFTGTDGDYEKTVTRTRMATVRLANGRMGRRKREYDVTVTATSDTFKTLQRMGSTEWSMPPDIRTFLARYLEITEQDVLNIRDLYGF
jgi:hypothetical protein